MKKTIYYWSPCLAKIATIKATINSAISLAKYSKMYEIKIIDVCGEWSKHKNYLLSQNIKLVNLTFNYYNFLPKNGFIKSRISNLIIILISIIPRSRPAIYGCVPGPRCLGKGIRISAGFL